MDAIKQIARDDMDEERLRLAAEMMSGAYFVWRLGLTAEEQNKPEAAAVLAGMLDACAQVIGGARHDDQGRGVALTRAVILTAEVDGDRFASPGRVQLKIAPGLLIGRVLTASKQPLWLPWVIFAGSRTKQMLLHGTGPTNTFVAVVDAVKAGEIPAAIAVWPAALPQAPLPGGRSRTALKRRNTPQ